ncbi:GIY-YIG nuclease family protein [Hymenobacter sp. J193]|uniref:GIY-YIG nuclease family protein n=1 Tax=Hymenobacter sp. J193 TaxID=2898429 RepID=UPI002151C455|nr:GIY-YIG nuclease family protein [Hymenobacter sp. J193]MCR5888321.1 GIY-YIG nuclease family protein [Hymenobacter sp. J193]
MTSQIIETLGFSAAGTMVTGRVSIADLFPKSRKRCGIYLLQFRDGTFYIGQAVDAVRRFAQHRKNYDTIEGYWFQAVAKQHLDETEQRLIRQGEQAGLLLTNKTFVTNVIGETDLDLLVSAADQEAWLINGMPLDNEGVDLGLAVEERMRARYRQNSQQLQQLPAYKGIKELLQAYITQGIPAFKKTEQSFWALSCLPSTNKGKYPRYFALNMNGMEVLVAGTERSTNYPFVFAVVTGSFCADPAEKARFLRSYAYSIVPSAYQAAGADQYRVDFKSMSYLLLALQQEPEFRRSIREMSLRLMRKGGTIYAPYHCFDLVQDVLG